MMSELNIAPKHAHSRTRTRLRRVFPRRRHLRRLKAVRPRRKHVRTALMATAPTAALFGFAGMQQAQPSAAVAATMPAGDIVPFADPMAPRPSEPTPAAVEASYYGKGFAGKPTANGETFNPGDMTAAHRTLPFGTVVRVTDAVTGKSVEVRINDRGPFHGNREIDLSEGAARKLGMIGAGTAKVVIETVRTA